MQMKLRVVLQSGRIVSHAQASPPPRHLNPIEGFWPVLQAAVSPRGVRPRPTAALKRKVKAWFRLRHKQSCVKALVGMRSRMDELVERDFGTTSH